MGLIDSGAITLVRPWNDLVRRSYRVASERRIPIYDATFIALSLELGLAFKTFDQRAARIAWSLSRRVA